MATSCYSKAVLEESTPVSLSELNGVDGFEMLTKMVRFRRENGAEKVEWERD